MTELRFFTAVAASACIILGAIIYARGMATGSKQAIKTGVVGIAIGAAGTLFLTVAFPHGVKFLGVRGDSRAGDEGGRSPFEEAARSSERGSLILCFATNQG